MQPGDEVITVSHTFIACANVIRQCGATPVFIDIEPVGYGMDAAEGYRQLPYVGIAVPNAKPTESPE